MQKYIGGPKFFGCSPSPDPRQFWSKTLFFGKLVPNPICVQNLKLLGKLVPNPICVPNLKLLASTVAEIRRGPKFLDAPLAKPPSNFDLKRCFWQATPRTQVV